LFTGGGVKRLFGEGVSIFNGGSLTDLSPLTPGESGTDFE
jgi:hypothetical protein